jgi:enoyl-CoA hydratase
MIQSEDRGAVRILHMVRGKGNALNADLVDALADALEKLAAGPARAGVITGQGNVFGAGVDLQSLVEGGADYARRFLPGMGRLFERLATFPKPMVAAVNGHAIAGGAILVFTCDQRIMARGKGRVGLTEVLVGVTFPARALEISRFAIPSQHFPTAVCTGRTWPPEEALARGLVDELVDPEKLLDRACEVANEMGAISPRVFTETKLAVRRPMIEAAREQAAKTDDAVLEHWLSPKTMAEVAKFVEQTIKKKG